MVGRKQQTTGTVQRWVLGPCRSFVIIAFLAAFQFSASSTTVQAQQPPREALPSSRNAWLQHQIHSLLSNLPHAQTQVGVSVIDLNSRTKVYEHNPSTSLVPASVMKVMVMAAAITHLGPSFTFETKLGMDGTNLIVIGDGDPAFGDEKTHDLHNAAITSDFVRWAEAIAQRGIHQIPGDLVIDETIFDTQWLHPAWEHSDLDNWYAAPVGGLNFNGNCVDITIEPQANGQLAVSFEPNNSLVRIINQCRIGKGQPVLRHAYDSFEYKISGRCNRRWPFGSVSFPDPGMLFADSLRTVLQQKGIRLSGQLVRGKVRNTAKRIPKTIDLLGVRRTPLPQVLARIGKDSQNLFAECLLKRLGYEAAKRSSASSPVGSWKTGNIALRDFLRQAQVDLRGIRLSDGSGLSRNNQCTARQMTDLLVWMQEQPNVWLLYDSLAISGEPGSLHRRLDDIPRRVFAKTGTMKGITALAGYALGYDGSHFAFTIMFNGYPGPSSPYRKMQDDLCRILVGDPSRTPE